MKNVGIISLGCHKNTIDSEKNVSNFKRKKVIT